MRFDPWRFGLRRASVPFEEQSYLRYGSIGGTVLLEVRYHWRSSPITLLEVRFHLRNSSIRGSVPFEEQSL